MYYIHRVSTRWYLPDLMESHCRLAQLTLVVLQSQKLTQISKIQALFFPFPVLLAMSFLTSGHEAP